MDGPNVNLKLLKLVQAEREENEQYQLIDIGSCGIHTIHNSFKTGTEDTDWHLKKILKGSYRLFHDSPARRDDFFTVTKCNQFPSSFCATRWIEDRPVAERLLELWPSIIKIVNHWESLSKSKRPSSKSYQNVLTGVNDNLTPAKLNFFSYVAGIFQPFLTKYQSDKPMVPFLHEDLLRLIKKIFQIVIKPDIVSECSSVSALRNIDLNDKSNYLKGKDFKIGFAARECITNLRKSDLISSKDLTSFYNECITFVTTTLSKLFDRSPLGSVIVRNADALSPLVIAETDLETLVKKMSSILTHFRKLKLITPEQADKALEQYSTFVENLKRSNLSELKLFDQSKTRLDFFYFHVLGAEVKKAGKSFAHVLKLILTLSHGQAAVERGFSLGKSSLQTNISEESIIAKKVVRDYLLANQVKVSTFSAPSKLILSCKSARARYHTSLEEKAKNSAKDARKVKRELLKEEINELVVRELKLKKTCESLESDFVNLVSEAEKRPDEMVSLITKANALKRRQTELNMDLEELQSQIEGKRQKLT